MMTRLEVQLELGLSEQFIDNWTSARAVQEARSDAQRTPAMPVVRTSERGMLFPRALVMEWLLKYFGSGYGCGEQFNGRRPAEVLDGPVVLVEVKDENSPPEVRRVSVKALTREQGYQVFSSTGVRREDEQVAWIIEQRERARRAKLSGPAPSAGQVVLQPRTDEGPGYILVNGVRLTHAQLEQYAKATR